MYFSKNIRFIGVIMIAILLFTGCVSINTQNNKTQNLKDTSEDTAKELPKDSTKELTKELNKEQAMEIEKEFFNRALNLEMIEETYEIVKYRSKEALINDISEVADKNLAAEFVNDFYSEDNGKLYVIPQGGPAKIIPSSPYEFSKIDENTYEIIQDEQDMLRGPYRVIVEFKYIDNKWKMSDRKEESKISEGNNTLTEEGIFNPEHAKKVIEEIANKVIYAISIKDSETLSEFVHPTKGVRFTPYTYVSLENDIVFNKDEMKDFFNNQDLYIWGYYDGKGDEVNLTPSEYYKEFIYSEDFVNAPEIGYNEILSSGNMIENQFDIYDNAIIVEYYFPGFNPDYEGIDWKSLRLVFEKYENTWKLVSIIHNQWTI